MVNSYPEVDEDTDYTLAGSLSCTYRRWCRKIRCFPRFDMFKEMATEEASEEYRFSIFWNKIIHEYTGGSTVSSRPIPRLNMMMELLAMSLFLSQCKCILKRKVE